MSAPLSAFLFGTTFFAAAFFMPLSPAALPFSVVAAAAFAAAAAAPRGERLLSPLWLAPIFQLTGPVSSFSASNSFLSRSQPRVPSPKSQVFAEVSVFSEVSIQCQCQSAVQVSQIVVGEIESICKLSKCQMKIFLS